MERSVIRFYTLEFFEELARRLNKDEDWKRTVAPLDLTIVCSAVDLHRAFLLSIHKGHVVAQPAPPDAGPTFKFEGPYEAWMRLCKGEREFEDLVQTGAIRVVGSMPDLMGLFGPLNHIVLVARQFPKEF